MSLLQKAGDLYRQLLIEKSATHPAVVQYRTWLVTQFQGEGNKVALQIEKERKAGELQGSVGKSVENAKPNRTAEDAGMVRFRHPSEGMGKPMAQRGGGAKMPSRKTIAPLEDDPDYNEGAEMDLRDAAQGEGVLGLDDLTMDSLTRATLDTSTETGADTEEPTQGDDSQSPVAAPIEGEPKTRTRVKFTAAEREEIAASSPKAVADKYAMARIQAYFDKEGIIYRADATHRQLAAQLVQHLKQSEE